MGFNSAFKGLNGTWMLSHEGYPGIIMHCLLITNDKFQSKYRHNFYSTLWQTWLKCHPSVLEMKYWCKRDRWIMWVHIILYNTNMIYITVINACREWHKLLPDLDILCISLSRHTVALGRIHTHSFCILNVQWRWNHQHNLHDLEKQSNFLIYYCVKLGSLSNLRCIRIKSVHFYCTILFSQIISDHSSQGKQINE